MGRKRNTAKTGDKALYKAREEELELTQTQKNKKADEDDMYNDVDRYNNARDELEDDMLRFGGKDDDSDDEEGVQNDVENVFDLGIDQDDDDDESDSSVSEDDESRDAVANRLDGDDDDDDDDDSSIEAGMDDLAEADILNWGKRKKDYYHGDTADLEIGQEVEDAELEEEAGKEVLKARLEGMTEDDFMLDEEEAEAGDTEEEETGTGGGVEVMTDEIHSSKRRKLAMLSKRDKIKMMTKTHPELMPLLSHFRDEVIQPCANETLVAANALLEKEENIEAVGANSNGIKYLLTKAMLQTATALNVCQYLLIKADQAAKSNDRDVDDILDDQDNEDIKNHPVISRLNQFNHLSEKLDQGVETKVRGLKNQMENLVKASALMAGGEDSSEEGEEQEETQDKNSISMDGEDVDMEENGNLPMDKNDSDDSSSTTSSSDDDDEEEGVRERRVLNEARFALRQQDDEDQTGGKSNKRRRRRGMPIISDIGDEDADEAKVTAAGRKLASTINKITQKSKAGKKSAAPEVNDDDDDARLMRGLAMMEGDLGEGEDEDLDGEIGADDDFDSDGDDFYSQIKKKSKAKKEYKKSLYAVAPKYPGFDGEIEGERAIGQMIMNNRGLVAHKNKLNRNPRVKKREQYRKALIRRKGAVREVRTDEGHRYGGEETGIRSGLSRSRKLGVR